jgi:hypothetical protein
MTVFGFDKSAPRMDIKVTPAKLRNDTFYKMADGRTMILSPGNHGGMKWAHDSNHVLSKDLTEGYYLRSNNGIGFINIGLEWQQAALYLVESGYLTLSLREPAVERMSVKATASPMNK